MNTITSAFIAILGMLLVSALPGMAQDIHPRGPLEWTVKNWIGFFIQIALFIVAVIAIYKLGTKHNEDEDMNEKNERKM